MAKLDDSLPHGWHLVDLPLLRLPLKAAYGLYLMRVCKEADRQSTALGAYVPHRPISLEAFKRHRLKVNKGDTWYAGMVAKTG